MGPTSLRSRLRWPKITKIFPGTPFFLVELQSGVGIIENLQKGEKPFGLYLSDDDTTGAVEVHEAGAITVLVKGAKVSGAASADMSRSSAAGG
ncbi:hypothetical protein ES332_A13G246800v1 [Gossypium tomentosum]|uniref:Uncharacterized protein n=1 Tax=Gossypium tomentosum TaxID=34277 RepID=A0A5D2MQ93_GOSTO|nr:hypothetical protein ES332_A13G246800v1 [Gossypium tomentosum]